MINPRETDVMIFSAGGLGTRLQPVVPNRPKALAEINDRPFLHRVFAQVETAGFRRVIFCTGFRADQIEEEFRDYSGNLELVFSREEKPLGTAGALGFAARCVQTPQVLVLNGDSFVDTNLCGFTDWYGFHHFDVGLIAASARDAGRFGTLEIEDSGKIIAFREKCGRSEPAWINAGAYLISYKRLSEIPGGRPVSLEAEIFPAWAAQGVMGAYRVHDRFIDIGTPKSYAEAVTFFADEAHVA